MSNQLGACFPNDVDKGLNRNPKEKTSPTNRTHSKIVITTLLVLSAAFVIVGWILLESGVHTGAEQLMNSFTAAFNTEKNSAYEKSFTSAFERAKQRKHVSNRVQISVGDLQETQRLEVLRASDVEFITEDRDDNSGRVTAWLEVEGEGIFVVDLQAAEFVIDDERKSVLVRIPVPELTNVSITRTTRRLFADDIFNGSYSEGVDLALKQRNAAILQIEKALRSNQYVYGNAKDVSKSMLRNLVLRFNPDIKDLCVEVEFFE